MAGARALPTRLICEPPDRPSPEIGARDIGSCGPTESATMSAVVAPAGSGRDVNDIAWDPTRDSVSERRSTLRFLDPVPATTVVELLDPARRTSDGRPLGDRERLLLLGCTSEDLEAIANEINVSAEFDDDSEHSELHEAHSEFEKLLGKHRLMKSDSDARTLVRMPLSRTVDAPVSCCCKLNSFSAAGTTQRPFTVEISSARSSAPSRHWVTRPVGTTLLKRRDLAA